MKKKILLSLFLLFLALCSPVIVSAENISSFQTGYAYTQVQHNIGLTWVTYSSNNNVMYNYDLPNSDEVEIEQFHFRISIGSGNQFKRGVNYIITFDWMNTHYPGGDTKMWFDRMIHTLYCRVNNWNATNESGSSCFSIEQISATVDSQDDSIIHVTASFTPIKDFFGLTIMNNFDNDPYSSYPSEGWEVYNYSYTAISDGSADIINNQNQNTQNIINNQNQNTSDILDGLEGVVNGATQNTEDIIDNQNQNTQALQDTINDNFQSCRNSYNLFRPRADFTSGILTMSDGVITLNGTLTSNTSIRVGYISAPAGSYVINPYKSGSINSSYYYFYINNTIFSFTGLKKFSLDNSLTDESVWLVLTRGDYDNITMNVMLNSGDTSLPYEKYGEQVCKNKLDETTDSINNLNDSINDSDTSDAESDGAGFFNSFTETDHGGLSAIITAPLVVVNSMLTSNSCPDLQFQVLGANVSFPSGCILWNNATSTIVTLWQTIVCGFISYCLLRKLFKDIENLKNPQDQEVSTLDL